MAKSSEVIWFLLYLVFGFYFINYSLVLWTVPEIISGALEVVHKWLLLVGGVLIIVGGINHYRASKAKAGK